MMSARIVVPVDGFLKSRGVYEPWTPEDMEQDIRDLHRVGL
jgi:hypothetical protein